MRNLLRHRTAVIGLVLVGTPSVAPVLAPLLSRHDPNAADVARRFLAPSREVPLGNHLGVTS